MIKYILENYSTALSFVNTYDKINYKKIIPLKQIF